MNTIKPKEFTLVLSSIETLTVLEALQDYSVLNQNEIDRQCASKLYDKVLEQTRQQFNKEEQSCNQ